MNKEILPYNLIAEILVQQNQAISLDRLSLISGYSKEDILPIIDFFHSKGFLKPHSNYSNIELKRT
jgi:hypothetical protein